MLPSLGSRAASYTNCTIIIIIIILLSATRLTRMPSALGLAAGESPLYCIEWNGKFQASRPCTFHWLADARGVTVPLFVLDLRRTYARRTDPECCLTRSRAVNPTTTSPLHIICQPQ
ncbi:hypothetical protein C8Q78DRAFT_458213 [Trametes maxima]|nr:hypothetical protein C8Q78DRAFT_458213 [Trametes maxima]